MDISDQRRELSQKIRDLSGLLRRLDTRRPQLCASLYRHRIRCGRPTCHCAGGPGHWRWCLSFESARGRHTRSLSEEELRKLSPGAQAYRDFRQIRAQAARLFRSILALIDRVQKSLAKSPKPPPRHA